MQYLKQRINHLCAKFAPPTNISTQPGTVSHSTGGRMHIQSMKFITTIVFALFTLMAGGVSAQVPKSPLAFKPDAPDRYTVVRGDTLWGIAARFTDSPWRWPEIWNLNKDQIKNPHWIYPGDVIVLDRSRGQLALDNTVKLSPRIRAEGIAREAIPSIPPNAIEPFLNRPLVVEPDGLDRAPHIVAAEESRVILGNGGVAYVRGMGDSKAPSWMLYRLGDALVDPDSNTTLGYEAIYLGTARLDRPGEPAKVVLTSVTREVGAGDRLIPAGDLQIVNYAPHAPATQVNGRVMSIYGGVGKVGEAGLHSVITLNRGKADGLEVGHVLALYGDSMTVTDRTRTKGDPDAMVAVPGERKGLVFVFRVFDRVSYAIVMQLQSPVRVRDLAKTP